MFGMKFGGEKNKVESRNAGPAPVTSVPEGVSKKESSGAWKYYLTLFLGGFMSVQSLEAASLKMTPEEKKDAVEYMKTSPDNVLKYEQDLLKKAESVMAQQNGESHDGHEHTKKVFAIDSNSAAYIEYVDGQATSINVRESSKEGTKAIFSDGLNGKIDGIVDNVTIYDSEGKKTSFGFVMTEKVDEDGRSYSVATLTGINVDPGSATVAFVNAQKGFEGVIQDASLEGTELASN